MGTTAVTRRSAIFPKAARSVSRDGQENRRKQTKSLGERLQKLAYEAREAAGSLPGGPQGDMLAEED
jgi:hypothetical protein